MKQRLSLLRAWHARSRREQWLLAAALIASLSAGGYWLANTHLMALLGRLSVTRAASPALVQRLPAVLSVDADEWRRAALAQGLVLDSISVEGSSVFTVGEARTPEAFVAFSRWAARQGWWALDWTLTQETPTRLTIDVRWMSQLEESPLLRRTP